MFGDGVAVGRAGGQRPENQQVEGSLQQFHARCFRVHCVVILRLDSVVCLLNKWGAAPEFFGPVGPQPPPDYAYSD